MLLFALCLYFFFFFFTLHVSGFHKPIIRGISSWCLYATIWFMRVFVDHLRAPVDWFVVVSSPFPQTSPQAHTDDQQTLHEPNGSI
jgi:hypothetical protein